MAQKKWQQYLAQQMARPDRPGAIREVFNFAGQRQIPWDRFLTFARKRGKVDEMNRMAQLYGGNYYGDNATNAGWWRKWWQRGNNVPRAGWWNRRW